jgi:hypothetical protein
MLTDSDILEDWLEALDRAEAEEFVSLGEKDQEPNPAWAEAMMWASHFFQAEASPFQAANLARHSFHLARPDTFDFLRHEYTSQGIDLVVTECMTFTCTRAQRTGIDLSSVPDKKEFINRIAETVLKVDDPDEPWLFQYPQPIGEGAMFSTNPDADLHFLSGWRHRVDGVIRHGKINFLCYKRAGLEIGIRDPWKWFDEQFRAWAERKSVKARAKPQAVEQLPSAGRRCPSCGATNPPENNFCGACGTRL